MQGEQCGEILPLGRNASKPGLEKCTRTWTVIAMDTLELFFVKCFLSFFFSSLPKYSKTWISEWRSSWKSNFWLPVWTVASMNLHLEFLSGYIHDYCGCYMNGWKASLMLKCMDFRKYLPWHSQYRKQTNKKQQQIILNEKTDQESVSRLETCTQKVLLWLSGLLSKFCQGSKKDAKFFKSSLWAFS